jgi:hypothetical protein
VSAAGAAFAQVERLRRVRSHDHVLALAMRHIILRYSGFQ